MRPGDDDRRQDDLFNRICLWYQPLEDIDRRAHVFEAIEETLIAAGVDIVTISRRLGHAKSSVALAIRAHMFHTDDSKGGSGDRRSLADVVTLSGWNGPPTRPRHKMPPDVGALGGDRAAKPGLVILPPPTLRH